VAVLDINYSGKILAGKLTAETVMVPARNQIRPAALALAYLTI